MKSLASIVQVVSRQKIRKLDVLSAEVLDGKSSKLKELYDGLLKGTIRNDRDAAMQLYAAQPSDARYRQLKSRFRKKLLNTLLLLDQGSATPTDYSSAKVFAQREWAQICIMLQHGAEEAALASTKTLASYGAKLELCETVIACARLLRHVALQEGDLAQIAELDSQIQKGREQLECELECERLYMRIQSVKLRAFANPELSHIDRLDLLKWGNRIDLLIKKSPSSLNQYLRGAAWCRIFQLRAEPDNLLGIHKQVGGLTQDKQRLVHKALWQEIVEASIWACLQIGTRVEASQLCQQLLALNPEGSSGWLEAQCHSVTVALHAQDFQRAFTHCDQVIAWRGFRQLPNPEQERWNILTAICIEQTLHYSAQAQLKDFGRWQKFVRSFVSLTQLPSQHHEQLVFWRKLVQILIFRHHNEQKQLASAISALRAFAVKRLQAPHHKALLAMAQLLYRLELRNFDGQLDKVATRHLEVVMHHEPLPCYLIHYWQPIHLREVLNRFGLHHEALAA